MTAGKHVGRVSARSKRRVPAKERQNLRRQQSQRGGQVQGDRAIACSLRRAGQLPEWAEGGAPAIAKHRQGKSEAKWKKGHSATLPHASRKGKAKPKEKRPRQERGQMIERRRARAGEAIRDNALTCMVREPGIMFIRGLYI